MKPKEIYKRLAQLQSRAYNLQCSIQKLMSEIDKDLEEQKKLDGDKE
jgi:hypothetical protein